MFDQATRDRLLAEALERRDTLTESHSTGYSTGRGTVFSPYRLLSADPGRVLHEVHYGGRVARLIAAETGAVVVPSTAAYLYYRSGDFTGIHTDGNGFAPFEINAVPFLLSGQRIPHQREPRDRHRETVVLLETFAMLAPDAPDGLPLK